MKKVFIAYRYTGEPEEKLMEMVARLKASLVSVGLEAICSFESEDDFQKAGMNPGNIVEYMCRKLSEMDYLLAVVKTDDKSEGMLIEVGYRNALKDHKLTHPLFILAVKRGVYTHMRFMANVVLEFEDLEDLCVKISHLSFEDRNK